MRTEMLVIFAGGNAGGTAAVDVLADANSRAHETECTLHIVDPNGENLRRIADHATGRGLRVTTEQKSIEIALADRTDSAPLCIFIDAPASIAAALEAAVAKDRPILLYVAILLATGHLLGLRAVLPTANHALAGQLAKLFRAISGATVRSGASAVFGAAASPPSAELEPHIRRWFAAHMVANIYKLLYNLPPVSAPVEVTRDGMAAIPLVIHDSTAAWDDPQALMQRILARPPLPIAPGTDVVIAEIGPNADVRLHEARLRRADRQIALRNASVPTVAGIGWPSLESAVRRITQNAISPAFPVGMTD
jgi:hypothetical protein